MIKDFFVIKDDIPIPPRANARKTEPGPVRKVMSLLMPGQCVLFPVEWYGVVQSNQTDLSRRWGRKFVRRAVDEGIMIWRTE